MLMGLMCWVKAHILYRRTVAFSGASKEVGLKVNAEKVKYVLVSF